MRLLGLAASAHELGLAGHVAVNQRAGLVPTDAGASLNELALKNQLVAGLDNALETSLVNAGKEKQRPFPGAVLPSGARCRARHRPEPSLR